MSSLPSRSDEGEEIYTGLILPCKFAKKGGEVYFVIENNGRGQRVEMEGRKAIRYIQHLLQNEYTNLNV